MQKGLIIGRTFANGVLYKWSDHTPTKLKGYGMPTVQVLIDFGLVKQDDSHSIDSLFVITEEGKKYDGISDLVAVEKPAVVDEPQSTVKKKIIVKQSNGMYYRGKSEHDGNTFVDSVVKAHGFATREDAELVLNECAAANINHRRIFKYTVVEVPVFTQAQIEQIDHATNMLRWITTNYYRDGEEWVDYTNPELKYDSKELAEMYVENNME